MVAITAEAPQIEVPAPISSANPEIDADRAAEPLRENEGRDQRGNYYCNAGEPDLRNLRGHELQAEQDDAEPQHAFEAERDAGFGPCGRAEDIVEQHAKERRQDHRAQDFHAWHMRKRHRAPGSRRRKRKAWQQLGGAGNYLAFGLCRGERRSADGERRVGHGDASKFAP